MNKSEIETIMDLADNHMDSCPVCSQPHQMCAEGIRLVDAVLPAMKKHLDTAILQAAREKLRA